jgi:TadE-like protein
MKLKLLRDDTRGGALVEFSVVLPFFLLLTFGLIQAGLLLWTQAGLQHGVEVATRCASVNYSANQLGLNTSCFNVAPSAVTNDTIKQYALDHSFGLVPSISSFTVTETLPTTPGICPTNIGYVVTASAPYNLINYIFSVTLTATSKFSINCN